jgi:hypothetical protein
MRLIPLPAGYQIPATVLTIEKEVTEFAFFNSGFLSFGFEKLIQD